MDSKYDNEIAYSYDKYVEDIDKTSWEEYLADDIADEERLQKYFEMEDKIMDRKIIKISDLTTDEQIEKLVDYVWKGEYLIPAEKVGE